MSCNSYNLQILDCVFSEKSKHIEELEEDILQEYGIKLKAYLERKRNYYNPHVYVESIEETNEYNFIDDFQIKNPTLIVEFKVLRVLNNEFETGFSSSTIEEFINYEFDIDYKGVKKLKQIQSVKAIKIEESITYYKKGTKETKNTEINYFHLNPIPISINEINN